MKRQITLSEVEYVMVDLLTKKSRLNPDQYLKKLIKDQYERLK